MHIALVVVHLSHASPGSFYRIHSMSKSLERMGVECTVLSPFSEDKHNIADVRIEVIPTALSKVGLTSLAYKVGRKIALSSKAGQIFFSREKTTIQGANSLRTGLKKVLRKNKFDLIHAAMQEGSLACIPVVKELKIPFVVDLHNIWEEETMSQLGHEDPDIRKRLHDWDQYIIDSSDGMTLASDYMKDYINKKFSINKKPLIVVPPGGFTGMKFNVNERKNNVIYAGMVSHREHVDLFARSTKFVKSPANFYISNHGETISSVKKIIRNPGYPFVNYIWFKRRSELLEFLGQCKIGIVTSQNDVARRLGPPLKLFEYLSCGIPVVANDIGGWCNLILEDEVGLITRDDPEEFAQAIDTLLKDDDLWNKMHTRCLNIIRTKYNWERYAKELLIPMYESVAGKAAT